MYYLHLGHAEQYRYTVGSTGREASRRIREILYVQRSDLYRIRKTHVVDGKYRYYNVVKMTRKPGCFSHRTEKVIKSFMVTKS